MTLGDMTDGYRIVRVHGWDCDMFGHNCTPTGGVSMVEVMT